jgi:uncharacterized membrane protein YeaQ/YmgE (transglycosylase-associated protein family)
VTSESPRGADIVGDAGCTLSRDVGGRTLNDSDLLTMIASCLAIGVSAGWIAARYVGMHGTEFWSAVALSVLGALLGPVVLAILSLGTSGSGTNIVAAAAGAILVLVIADPSA